MLIYKKHKNPPAGPFASRGIHYHSCPTRTDRIYYIYYLINRNSTG